jgi:PIN domain
MFYERLRLKEGADPKGALQALRQLINECGNAIAGGMYNERMTKYVRWVETAVPVLSGLTDDPAVVTMLYTDRYMLVRTASPDPYPTLDNEAQFQIGQLKRMADDLEERVDRLSAAKGHITVVDTHVLLHYQWAAHVRWDEVVRQPMVRLIVPLRVVEELDAKKWARRGELASRARRVLSALEGVIAPDGAPGPLRDGTTIEVPVERGLRFRPDDADEEILYTCRELAQLTRQTVTLVTGDTSTRIRASAQNIRVVRMPDTYLPREDQPKDQP